MENSQKITKFEAIGLMTIVVITQIILNLASYLVSSTGSSAWINIVYIFVILLFFCLFICKLFKPFNSKDILDVSEFLGGSFLKYIVGILYILFFIFFSSIVLKHFSVSLKYIYFKETPIIYIMFFFIIPIAIVSKLRYKKHF